MQQRFSDVWKRFLAHGVDGFILSILSWFANGVVLPSLLPAFYAPSVLSFRVLAVSIIAYNIIGLIYYTLSLVHYNGATVGKNLLAIKVVRTDGTPLTYGRSLIRALSYYVSTISFGLGFLWAFWDKHKQTWHDKIAGTYVVETGKKPKKALAYVLLALFLFSILYALYAPSLFSERSKKSLGIPQSPSPSIQSIRQDAVGEEEKKEQKQSRKVPQNQLPSVQSVLSGAVPEAKSESGFQVVYQGSGMVPKDEFEGHNISLDKYYELHVNVVTDKDASIFLLTKEEFSKAQNEQEFNILERIQSNTAVIPLIAGDYVFMIVPIDEDVRYTLDLKVK